MGTLLRADELVFVWKEGEGATEEAKKSNHVTRKLEKRQQGRTLDPHIEEQFGGGRLLAAISSRPGQCGRADGYVIFLEIPFLEIRRSYFAHESSILKGYLNDLFFPLWPEINVLAVSLC